MSNDDETRVPIAGMAQVNTSWDFDRSDIIPAIRETIEQAKRELGRREVIDLIVFTEEAYRLVLDFIQPKKEGREPEDAPKRERLHTSIMGIPMEVYGNERIARARIQALRLDGDQRRIMLVAL